MRRRRAHDLLDDDQVEGAGSSVAGVLVAPGPQLVVTPFIPVGVHEPAGRQEDREYSTNAYSFTTRTYARA